MYDCINEAYNYLKDKYGYKRTRLTANSSNKLVKARNKKERLEILESFTDRNYVLKLNEITEDKDKYIDLLMRQYYYGISVKKELYYTLVNMGVIEYENQFA